MTVPSTVVAISNTTNFLICSHAVFFYATFLKILALSVSVEVSYFFKNVIFQCLFRRSVASRCCSFWVITEQNYFLPLQLPVQVHEMLNYRYSLEHTNMSLSCRIQLYKASNFPQNDKIIFRIIFQICCSRSQTISRRSSIFSARCVSKRPSY